MRWLAWLGGCQPDPVCDPPVPVEVDQPNLLVVVIDDVGIDQLGAWGVPAPPVPTPTLDCLCGAGVRFHNVWAAPYCTPARVALWSGRHPRRHGIGRFINVGQSSWELPLEEVTVAEALATAGYTSAFIGKWHIGAFAAPSGRQHPNLQGFDSFTGVLGNIDHLSDLGPQGTYTAWEHLTDGEAHWREGYLTEALVDDALDRIDALPEPWLAVVSFQGAHSPLHAPPRDLVGYRVRDSDPEIERYRAMVAAVDTEIGRLLRGIDPGELARTQIWTMSDNGTPAHGIWDADLAPRGKGSLFEAGVRIPLVVSGSGVGAVGDHSEALVSILDVFPSLLALAGAADHPSDGVSLLPLLDDPTGSHRSVLYADLTDNQGRISRAVRSASAKLKLSATREETAYELYDGLREVEVDTVDPDLRAAMDDFIAEFSR